MVITIFTDKTDDSFNIQEVSEEELNTFKTIVFPITKAGFDRTFALGTLLNLAHGKEVFFYISPTMFNMLEEEDKKRLTSEKIIWQISGQEKEMIKFISAIKPGNKLHGTQNEITKMFEYLSASDIFDLTSKVSFINLDECSIIRKWTL